MLDIMDLKEETSQSSPLFRYNRTPYHAFLVGQVKSVLILSHVKMIICAPKALQDILVE